MGPDTVLFIGLMAVFASLVVLLTTIGVLTTERQQVGRSLAAVRAVQSAPAALRREVELPFGERVLAPLLARLGRLGRRVSVGDQASRVRSRLARAGSPANWDVERVLAVKLLGLLIGAALGVLLPLVLGTGVLVVCGACLLLAALGFYTPDLVLYQATYARKERMKRELPDALDLLAISVEAGLAFDAALAQVSRNTVGPLAEEFFRVLQEMQIGMSRSDALRGLADRTELPDLRGFVTAMVQADSFGVPVSRVLSGQAAEMRIKRSQRAEELAQKVPVKILFPLIFCILPALFVVVIGPAAINIVHTFSR